MLADEPDGDLLDLDGIPEGAEPLVESDEKGPLVRHARHFVAPVAAAART
jgi:hypothetical protein